MLLYRASVRVNAPPERVWEWLSDWDRSAQWMLGTTVEVIGPQREGVGARTRARTKIAGITLIDEMSVTRWEPPRFLQAGDDMIVRVEGLGELRNPVAAE